MDLLQTKTFLRISPLLAQRVGDRPAIFLHQLDYWLKRSKFEYEGKKWIYNSFPGWQENFPFWSINTLKRIIKYLVEKKLIEIKQLDKNPLNHTNWYTVNYAHELLQLEENETEEKRKGKGLPKSSPFSTELESPRSTQNEPIDRPKMSLSGIKNSRVEFDNKINGLENPRSTQNEPIDRPKMSLSKHNITIHTENNIYRSNGNLTPMDFDKIDLKKLPFDLINNPLNPSDKKLLRYGAVCVLKFLNTQTNHEYRPKDSTMIPIMAHLQSGVTISDCWKIIRRKQREWGGTDLEKYLRVKTLFKSQTNFEEYLAELAAEKRRLLTNQEELEKT